MSNIIIEIRLQYICSRQILNSVKTCNRKRSIFTESLAEFVATNRSMTQVTAETGDIVI